MNINGSAILSNMDIKNEIKTIDFENEIDTE